MLHYLYKREHTLLEIDTEITERRCILGQTQYQTCNINGTLQTLFELALHKCAHRGHIALAVGNDMLKETVRHKSQYNPQLLYLCIGRFIELCYVLHHIVEGVLYEGIERRCALHPTRIINPLKVDILLWSETLHIAIFDIACNHVKKRRDIFHNRQFAFLLLSKLGNERMLAQARCSAVGRAYQDNTPCSSQLREHLLAALLQMKGEIGDHRSHILKVQTLLRTQEGIRVGLHLLVLTIEPYERAGRSCNTVNIINNIQRTVASRLQSTIHGAIYLQHHLLHIGKRYGVGTTCLYRLFQRRAHHLQFAQLRAHLVGQLLVREFTTNPLEHSIHILLQLALCHTAVILFAYRGKEQHLCTACLRGGFAILVQKLKAINDVLPFIACHAVFPNHPLSKTSIVYEYLCKLAAQDTGNGIHGHLQI